MMSRLLMAAVGTLALSGALAPVAHADPLKADATVNLADRNQWAPQPVHKSFQWDAGKGRWGVKLDLNQPAGRNAAWQDVQAGAYFNVTPSLSVGGAVALRDPSLLASPANPPGQASVANAPRVRLETAFKF